MSYYIHIGDQDDQSMNHPICKESFDDVKESLGSTGITNEEIQEQLSGFGEDLSEADLPASVTLSNDLVITVTEDEEIS